MEGQIADYSGASMRVKVTLSSGSGTFNSWMLGPVGGAPGAGTATSINGAVSAVTLAIPGASDILLLDGSDLVAIVDSNDRVLLAFSQDELLYSRWRTRG